MDLLGSLLKRESRRDHEYGQEEKKKKQDAPSPRLPVEEVGNQFDDTRNTSGTTNKDDFVDIGLVDLGVPKDFLNRLHGLPEEILAELFETGTCEGSVEVDTFEERVDLNGGLSGRGQSSLGTLASSAQTTNSPGIAREICNPREYMR
jgi:hypothetical protein